MCDNLANEVRALWVGLINMKANFSQTPVFIKKKVVGLQDLFCK